MALNFSFLVRFTFMATVPQLDTTESPCAADRPTAPQTKALQMRVKANLPYD